MMVAILTASLLPVKATTGAITIAQFPENPKSLILEQCRTRKDLSQIHAHLIKTRLILNPSIVENLLESAAVILPDTLDYALSIFRTIDEPESSAYNVMIRGLTYKQSPQEAIFLFKQMSEKMVKPDGFTFSGVFKACSKLKGLAEGEQIHARVVKCGFQSDGFVENTLVHMYATCFAVEAARRLFDGMSKRGLVAWNSLLAGYARNGCWEEVVNLFLEMRKLGIGFNEVTMVTVLSACGRLANLELGKWVGEFIEANGLEGNLTLITSLIDMYAKCGEVDTARKLFDQMKHKDVVAWSAMISGFSQANRCSEALTLFNEMPRANVDPNEVTMASVLYSCGVLGALETGKWVHSHINRKKLKLTVTLGTALIDFYAKCGSTDSSIEVFEKMPLKNVFCWTAIIQGLACNGEGRKALQYYCFMREANIEPNDVTFIGALSACSHAGLVDEGRTLFLSMNKDFGIEPRIEHYGCMVDILGRAGLIDEAFQFIMNMPIKPNAILWRTLLASCRTHKNVPIGEESFKQITKLEPPHSGDCILLSNMYALVGRSEDARRVRCQMREMGIKKSPGCSLIALGGVIHEFFSGDDKHSHSNDIYRATERMIRKIKSAGYEPDIAYARIDAEEEDKEAAVSHHSEKLAIAFGLIRTQPGSTIRISKNLRVCTDCHNATKIISKVYNREIIIRDWNRFHHFKEGSCSCDDFW